jgi:hypothetical protein
MDTEACEGYESQKGQDGLENQERDGRKGQILHEAVGNAHRKSV